MKKITIKFLITALAVIFFVPSVALASWWNPFSWFNKKPIEVPVSQSNIDSSILKIEPTISDMKQESKKDTVKKEIITIENLEKDLYKVISVVDGDTIKVEINGKIETLRLIGLDTPETMDPRKPVQCFAKEASKKAKDILNGKKVRLEADATQGERDKYDRLLRYVYLSDGTFYNKFMISEGYAHEYTYQSNPYKYQLDFKKAETEAREQERGLWSQNTCNGDTVKSANLSNSTIQPTTEDSDGPRVKKSNSGICHEKNVSTYYKQTKNYVPYDTIEDCLKSGGRLPKNLTQ